MNKLKKFKFKNQINIIRLQTKLNLKIKNCHLKFNNYNKNLKIYKKILIYNFYNYKLRKYDKIMRILFISFKKN